MTAFGTLKSLTLDENKPSFASTWVILADVFGFLYDN
jgi:hypothetical protein